MGSTLHPKDQRLWPNTDQGWKPGSGALLGKGLSEMAPQLSNSFYEGEDQVHGLSLTPGWQHGRRREAGPWEGE